mmetsp:Transcript_105660/g.264560  ORF Transcript_105660/g.264560 Transcript_105660/m.264560 type:complete len:88 (-) Transcript_105660:513-776(-)
MILRASGAGQVGSTDAARQELRALSLQPLVGHVRFCLVWIQRAASKRTVTCAVDSVPQMQAAQSSLLTCPFRVEALDLESMYLLGSW